MKIRSRQWMLLVALLANFALGAVHSNAQIAEVRFIVGSAKVLNVSLEPTRFSKSTALKMAPFGARTEWSGVARGKLMRAGRSTLATLLVHFYALPVKRKAVGKKAWRGFDLWCDCFITARRKPAKWERLQRVCLSHQWPTLNGNWARGSDSIQRVELVWIDEAKRQVSALRVRMSGESITGFAGCYGFITYPRGWSQTPTLQSFFEYINVNGELKISFLRLGAQKWLVVRSRETSVDTDYTNGTQKIQVGKANDFRWNGRYFEARNGQRTNF